MKKVLNEPLVPLISFLLYYTQGIIIPSGSIYSQGLLLIYFFYGFYCFIKLHKTKISNLTLSIDLFLFAQLIWSFATPYKFISYEPNDITYIVNIKQLLSSFLTYYIAYYYCKIGKLTLKKIVFFFILYVVLTIPKFIYNEIQVLESFVSRGSNRENITNNIAYLFLDSFCFLPLIRNNKKLSVVILATVMFFILYSSKRGAILIMAVLLLLYIPLLLKGSLQNKLIMSVLVVVLALVSIEWINENEYLIGRLLEMKEGNSSGRDSIFSDIWMYCTGAGLNVVTLLFGHGIYSTIIIAGTMAHNDWLELFCCCGLVGVVLFINLFISLFKANKKSRIWEYKECEKYAIIILGLKTLFSQSFTTATIIFLVIGFTQAQLLNKSNSILYE